MRLSARANEIILWRKEESIVDVTEQAETSRRVSGGGWMGDKYPTV